MKNQQFSGCGLLLMVALLVGCATGAPATSVSDRIGGQAGLGGDQDKLEHVADQSSSDRIGGQAGLRGDEDKLERVADQSAGDRIGGQAGLRGVEDKLERVADQSADGS
jgi:hypothetical protein